MTTAADLIAAEKRIKSILEKLYVDFNELNPCELAEQLKNTGALFHAHADTIYKWLNQPVDKTAKINRFDPTKGADRDDKTS